MGVYAKLLEIQKELKAPKGQYNSFGKYNYRSCEDILEAVKPLAHKNGCVVTISDSIEQIGERFYLMATAELVECETGEKVRNSAFAREANEKKGMDESQITGTASSYARKYALNGLFAIDDTKDADTDEHKNQTDGKKQGNKAGKPQGKTNKFEPSEEEIQHLFNVAANSKRVPENVPTDARVNKLVQQVGKQSVNELTKEEYNNICAWFEGK